MMRSLTEELVNVTSGI